MQAVLLRQLGLLLDNNADRTLAGRRLGSQFYEESSFLCFDLVKQDGVHGLS